MKFIRFCSNAVLAIFVVMSTSFSAFAGLTNTTPVPEPGILSLFAVAATIAYIIKKRGK